MKQLTTVALLIAIVGFAAFSQAKPGGIARQIAMGGSNIGTNLVVNPFLMDDPTLMLWNPAYQTMYKDYIWMNVGGGALNNLALTQGIPDNGYGHQFSGVSFALDNQFTLGMVLSYDPSFVNQVSGLIGGLPSPGGGLPGLPAFAQRNPQQMPQVANAWELLGSYDGGDLGIGFGFMYGSSNNDSKTSTIGGASSETEASARVFGFRAGVLADLGSGSLLDGNVAIRLDKATDNIKSNTGSGGEYSANGTEIQAGLRAKLKASNKFNFVPYATFASLTAEPKEDNPPTGQAAITNTEKLTATVFAVGLGGEYRTSSFLVAGGLSFQTAKAKLELGSSAGTTTGELTYTALPVFNLGGEWWFTDWLAGRSGYYRALASVKTKTQSSAGSSEQTITFPHSFIGMGALNPSNFDGLVTLGVGMRFGGFCMDATVSEEALRRGFGLIGSQDNINTFGYVTLSYNFE